MNAESLPTPGFDQDPHIRPKVYLTADIPGIGGVIKQRPEDFLVDEIPLYDPCGQGEHLYMLIEKKGMSTFEMIGVLATHFGVRPGSIGYAGLKDKHAVTRQVVSVHVPGRKIEDFPMLAHEKLGVLWVDYHANKLRPGHLRGNRFSIRVRGVGVSRVLDAQRVLRRLEATGVPNRVGEQRFGQMQHNHLVGRALLLGRFDEALRAFLGPGTARPDLTSAAREAFAAGNYREALLNTPRRHKAEDAALRALIRGGSPRDAMLAVDENSRKFFLSAFQSAVFNAVMDERSAEGTIGVLKLGDAAFKHDSRASFLVDDTVLGDPTTADRLARFEISPSGPMWSSTMLRARGAVDAAEIAALERFGVSVEDLAAFDRSAGHLIEGARRPLRVPVIDPQVEAGADEHGAYIRCAFELPRGSFATVVLREIMKPADDGAADPEAGE